MLTKREQEVLKLLREGKNNIEIAEILHISKHTAKAHVTSIIRKLECRNRTNAAYVAGKINLS